VQVDEAVTNKIQQAKSGQESKLSVNSEEVNLAREIRKNHHDAIWEEQKHFTWLISIILSGQLVVFIGSQPSPSVKIALIVVSSLIGILLSLTAFRVQRIEGIYFNNANIAFNEAYRKFFGKDTGPSAERTEKIAANKDPGGLIIAVLTNNSGVRDQFQFIFLSFIVVFAAIAIYACVVF
jgi:ABC-type branched-subunit amino acid transport system permease subunit